VTTENPNVPGATMRYWLADTLEQLRERAGISLEEVAWRSKRAGGSGYSQLSRFEAGEAWPREFDHVVVGYADALGVADPRELWQLALDRWREHGAMPSGGHREDGSDSPSRRFADLIAEQAARDRARSQTGPPGKPNATRKRRAAGG
jgi:hypothetical protein